MSQGHARRWTLWISKIVNFLPILMIRLYRKCISPLFPPSCRFHPSCSAYGLEAFQKHPFHRALWLTVWRIMRCNPFNPGGYDPVPEPKGSTEAADPPAKNGPEHPNQRGTGDEPSDSGAPVSNGTFQ